MLKIKLNFEFNTRCTGFNEKYEEFYFDTEEYQFVLSEEKSLNLITRFVKEWYGIDYDKAKLIAEDLKEEIYDIYSAEIEDLGVEIYYDEAYDKWKSNRH